MKKLLLLCVLLALLSGCSKKPEYIGYMIVENVALIAHKKGNPNTTLTRIILREGSVIWLDTEYIKKKGALQYDTYSMNAPADQGKKHPSNMMQEGFQ